MALHYRIPPDVELVETRSGPALLGWTPLRLVRVNAALGRLLRGGDFAPSSPAAAQAIAALERRRLVVRDVAAREGEPLPTVSVVIPVKDRAEELRRCLASLARLRYPRELLEIVVVDDGSQDDGPAVARAAGARVLPSGGCGLGPAAARNRGSFAATGEILAFLDSDCVASEGWLAELVGAFADPAVAAVGGRVDGLRSASALDRYEAEMSSLTLGARERWARPGEDTFYLPSCNLLVRRSAFAELGGFREELHVAEDVDLSWRLRDRGAIIGYVPQGAVLHEHRNRLWPFLRRRFEYGTSEGVLDLLHPSRRKRIALPPVLVAGGLSAVATILALSWIPAALGAAVVATDAAAFWWRLRRQLALPFHRVLAARLRALGSLVYFVAYHLVRYHAPALAIASLAWPRFGLLAGALALWPAAMDYRLKRPSVAFPPFLAFYVAEHFAYGAGVFRGCLRQRTFRTYRPAILRDPW